MVGTAVFSPCGIYRYVLTRSLGGILRWYRPILFVMLNPSVADASADDPTIRRCIGLAKREGRTHLTVVNLFGFRSTDPRHLKVVTDPVGPENDFYIAREIQKHRSAPVICAWGSNPVAEQRGFHFVEHFKESDFFCIGKTKSGAPRHPLFSRADQPLARYP